MKREAPASRWRKGTGAERGAHAAARAAGCRRAAQGAASACAGTLLVLAASIPAAAAPGHLPLIAQAVSFAGGELYEQTETTLTLGSAGGSFDLRVRRDGGLYELEVRGQTDDGTPRRALVGNELVREWRGGEPLALDAEGAARTRRFVQARVWFPFLPYGLLGEAVRHHDQGRERWGDRWLHRVKVTFEPRPGAPPPDEYVFWLDPDTARIEQYAYAYDRGTERAGLRFRTTHNHRRVGGILFHDVRNFGLDGRPDAAVDLLTPAFAAGLELVSEVTLSAIAVQRLGSP